MKLTTPRTRTNLTGTCLLLALIGLPLLTLNCSKREKTDKPASVAQTATAAPADGLPANVDRSLYSRLQQLSKSCDIDLRDADVKCRDRGLEKVSEQIVQGARSQSESLPTIAYALSQKDEKLVTVAAELLYLAYRAPISEPNRKATSKDTALNLVNALAAAPEQQAVKSAPAVIYAAFETGTEKELYAAVEKHSYKRLAARSYKYLMAAGGMKAWNKVKELAKSKSTEEAMAALDAPTMMREKTDSDRGTICDWYKTLVQDDRPIVVSRASGYLIVCGPSYIEQLLAADEQRLTNPAVDKLGLDSYRQMCTGMVAASGPTPEQCTRFRKLLTSAIKDERFDVQTRVNAIKLLAINFVDQDAVKLLQPYTKYKQPLIAETAAQSVTQINASLQGEPPAPGAGLAGAPIRTVSARQAEDPPVTP